MKFGSDFAHQGCWGKLPVPFQDFFAHLHDAKWTKVEGEGSCRLTSKDPISVCAKWLSLLVEAKLVVNLV